MAAETPGTSRVSPSSGTVVLLVCPHQDAREMYGMYLDFHGYRTVALADSSIALTHAPSADVIVTGLTGPHMDGIALVKAIRQDEATRHIPVIVLTACVFPSDESRAREAGCNAFLPMPCLPEDLLAAIQHVLQRRRRPTPARASLRGRRDVGKRRA